MAEWIDYYQVLNAKPGCTQEEIKKVYRYKASILHPDRLMGFPEHIKRQAEEDLKVLNQAYGVLKDPQKRAQYDSEWLKEKIKQKKAAFPKPSPVVNPSRILVKNLKPNETQTASFIVQNQGGPYNKIWISNPNNWVQVIGCSSLSTQDELPLRVEIEVNGGDWGQTYSEYIVVKLDEEDKQVRVQLQMKAKPIENKVWSTSAASSYSPPPYSSSSSPPSSQGQYQSSYSSGKDGESFNNHKTLTLFFLLIIGIILIYNFTKNSTKSFPEVREEEKNPVSLESKDISPEKEKTEEDYFIEVYNNPELINYLKFAEKYPTNLRKSELIKRVISSDSNLPSEQYWHIINKNDKGYWELPMPKAVSVRLVWIPNRSISEKNNPGMCSDKDMIYQKAEGTKMDGFWIGKHEVTVDQYKYFCEETGIGFPDFSDFEDMGNEPIRNISWNEANKYCEWLGCRLPTESEWENAARGEQGFHNFHWGEVFDPVFANIDSNKVVEIGSFRSNGFGLFDMIGNVAEWLQDWYNEDRISSNKQKLYKVIRGGSFKDKPAEATLLKRNYMFPAYKGEAYGFRVAMD